MLWHSFDNSFIVSVTIVAKPITAKQRWKEMLTYFPRKFHIIIKMNKITVIQWKHRLKKR